MKFRSALAGLLFAAALNGQSQLTVVNAADYVSQVAPGSIATAFGSNLPTESGTEVLLCEPTPSTLCLNASVLAATASQISFVVPNPLPSGVYTVEVVHPGGIAASGSAVVTVLSPAIFTVDNSGTGLFNGQAYDGGGYDAVYLAAPVCSTCAPAWIPRPISPTSGSGANLLVVYGTGWKNASAANTQVMFNSISAAPAYVGPSSIAGLDQLNVAIPASLAGPSAQLVTLSVSFTNVPSTPRATIGRAT